MSLGGAVGAAPPEPRDGEWLVIIDPQTVFADPLASPWGSPEFAAALPAMVDAATAYGQERTIVTRFVADAALGGSWDEYYREWPFALVADTDPLYAVVPQLRSLTAHLVTEPTFGKWTSALRQITGPQPRLALAGVSTDCCVISTALPAADAGAQIRILEAACAGSSAANHAQAIGAMALFGPQITII